MTSDRNATASKSLIIVSVVASSLLTGVVTFFVQYLSDSWARRDEMRLKDIGEFIQSGQEYRSLSSEFMRQFTQNDTYDIEKEKLLQNVLKQYSLINSAKAQLTGARLARAEAYQEQLSSLVELLGRGSRPAKSEPLVQELVAALATEVCVTYDLRSVAGLPKPESLRSECDAELTKE